VLPQLVVLLPLLVVLLLLQRRKKRSKKKKLTLVEVWTCSAVVRTTKQLVLVAQ
jgi:hypothetical protein